LQGVAVVGDCLMSNHVHGVVVPHQAEALAETFKEVHGRCASYWNVAHVGSGHVWQGRFHSCPPDAGPLVGGAALRGTESAAGGKREVFFFFMAWASCQLTTSLIARTCASSEAPFLLTKSSTLEPMCLSLLALAPSDASGPRLARIYSKRPLAYLQNKKPQSVERAHSGLPTRSTQRETRAPDPTRCHRTSRGFLGAAGPSGAFNRLERKARLSTCGRKRRGRRKV
jgi:hypothetical protein